jgi:diacylglycerol kinase family enzyme
MSKGAHDIFALVISFLNEKWQPQHITIGLFEANENTRWAMARNLIKLLNQYDLRKKIVAYVKDEGANLNAMTTTLNFVVDCEVLGLEDSFQGICFGHAFF